MSDKITTISLPADRDFDICLGFETNMGLQRLPLRPIGRRNTTVAIYAALSRARRAANRLFGNGIGMDRFSILESAAQPNSFVTDFVRLGVSRAGALNYETAVAEGHILLIVHGKLVETSKAAWLLSNTDYLGLAEYHG